MEETEKNTSLCLAQPGCCSQMMQAPHSLWKVMFLQLQTSQREHGTCTIWYIMSFEIKMTAAVKNCTLGYYPKYLIISYNNCMDIISNVLKTKEILNKTHIFSLENISNGF